MIESYAFLKLILDTITEQIAVIDRQGNIVFVNQAWVSFGQDNGCSIEDDWGESNYLTTCDESYAAGDEFGLKAATGIRKLIAAEESSFYLEYPCHSPTEKRWFMMRVTPFSLQDTAYFVISHQNITERRLVEEEVLTLSRMDGLTDIPNRRYFDKFLDNEWRRCRRLNFPITLAIIDLDHFKLLNDTYGHPAGDECLRKIGAVLKTVANRPSDICARYGGEEFAIVFGNTEIESAKDIIGQLLETIRALKIPNRNSPTLPTLTASIGLVTMCPSGNLNSQDLTRSADMLMYSAKRNGRNRIVSESVD